MQNRQRQLEVLSLNKNFVEDIGKYTNFVSKSFSAKPKTQRKIVKKIENFEIIMNDFSVEDKI